jgi:SAM-dependent methyltransferase
MKLTRAEWDDSQAHELAFWRGELAKGNTEQSNRWGWYSLYVFPEFFGAKSFRGLRLLDYGSGPQGVLHYISGASLRVACDPIMGEFRRMGYDVEGDGVKAVDALTDDLFDVIFCLNCLDHTGDPLAVLHDLAARLDDGGQLVVCVDLRPEHKLDAYHKLALTDEWMNAAVAEIGLQGERKLKPHQGENPTMQWCAVLSKRGGQ